MNSKPDTAKKRAEAQLRRFLQAHKTGNDASTSGKAGNGSINDFKITHSVFDASTLLNVQGPFYIPDRDKDQFYELYSRCYNARTRLNLIENKWSRKWSFFLDCDGKPDKTPTIVKYIKPLKAALLKTIIPATLQFAYGQRLAQRVQIEMQAKNNNPTRLHFLAPQIVLNAHTAKVLRS
jgi:hypothetical protein